jgi:hypothetical protein
MLASSTGVLTSSIRHASGADARSRIRIQASPFRICLSSGRSDMSLLPQGMLMKLKRGDSTIYCHAQPGDSSSSDQASKAPTAAPPELDTLKTSKRVSMETPDMISSQLTRRFGYVILCCSSWSPCLQLVTLKFRSALSECAACCMTTMR